MDKSVQFFEEFIIRRKIAFTPKEMPKTMESLK